MGMTALNGDDITLLLHCIHDKYNGLSTTSLPGFIAVYAEDKT
jgi:hypothetical protein